jgi:hypothetical protein
MINMPNSSPANPTVIGKLALGLMLDGFKNHPYRLK